MGGVVSDKASHGERNLWARVLVLSSGEAAVTLIIIKEASSSHILPVHSQYTD